MTANTSSPESVSVLLQGSPNFRDMGGYVAAGGRRVRRGSLFRSGHLSALTQHDLDHLQTLNIRLVFDFRRDEERQQEPSRFPTAAAPTIVDLPIDPGSTLNLRLLDGGAGADVAVEQVADFMCLVNREFVHHYSASFRAMFEHLLNHTDGGLLIHCSAGKDRTGFAAAMILSALGVPEREVIRDYLTSAHYFDVERELSRICRKYRWMGDEDVIRPLLEVREEYLRAALDAIVDKYSDLEQYLVTELGLDAAARDELRRRYLDEG